MALECSIPQCADWLTVFCDLKQVLMLQQTAENLVHTYSQWTDNVVCLK